MLVLLINPSLGVANEGIPTFIEKRDLNENPIEENDINPTIGNMTENFNGMLPYIYDTGMKFITVIFLIAVVALALSLIFKNGQWTKWSTGVMVTSLLIILFFRGGPIIVLTMDAIGITLFASDLLNFATSVGIYVAVGMILVSLLFRLFYKLINHPDYFRWSKRLMIGSVIIAVLSLVIPVVFLGA
ncbi:hypothetical protein CJ195_20995 [Bacillus sp. UMB0899]|nr:hypothetical protein CJ195_20995 [Bacillus sp. UMB0899]